MRVSGLHIYRTRLRCRKPFRIATGVSDLCQGLVVKLEDDAGHVGLGEAVPKPSLTGETLEGAEAALCQEIFPLLRGMDAWALEEIHGRLEAAVPDHPSARAAVDMALHDLLGRTAGVPLYRFLGGSCRRVLTNYSIGLCSPGEAAAEARHILDQGFRVIKLKVGGDADEDVARARAVREVAGPGVALRIDANEGWTYRAALRALRSMEPLDIELVEQPLPRWDLDGMAALRRRVAIPVAADESVRGPRDALRAIRARAVDIINIKLMKCGGLVPARRIATLARCAGVELMVGGMVGESRLAVGAAASLAAALGFEYADLDADLLLGDELVLEGGVALDRSERVLPEAPGLGVGELEARFLFESAEYLPAG
ncbi:MAG TPA: dipeptide epimerase [Candidatus Nitrosotenuis sp.]|jgi:o-succinylbenzoate synthase|nr:dipeptide epimerase [Candidatus Nitrosotenuis sp.]